MCYQSIEGIVLPVTISVYPKHVRGVELTELIDRIGLLRWRETYSPEANEDVPTIRRRLRDQGFTVQRRSRNILFDDSSLAGKQERAGAFIVNLTTPHGPVLQKIFQNLLASNNLS